MYELCLRPVVVEDADEFHAAHANLVATDRFALGLSYDPSEPFAAFVDRHRQFARGLELPDGIVPATFLVAIAQGNIVGRVSIRHELNDFLAAEGGHIGYGVLHDYRRRGYATEILRQSVIIARSHGVANALLVCDDDNVGSATVIECCGGQLVDRS
ncbi:MAG: putative acetyltransferase, partial [Candidatus Poriferisodalaceae bacterium]